MKAKEETSFSDGPNMLTRCDTTVGKHLATPAYVNTLSERPGYEGFRAGREARSVTRFRIQLGGRISHTTGATKLPIQMEPRWMTWMDRKVEE